MIFGWYGFALEHPEDWAPVTLSGDRKEGYVRIASPGRHALQIRWKASNRGVDLWSVLSTYLNRLAQDAKTAKSEFRSDTDVQSKRIVYRYSGAQHGRGAILQSEASGRVFFLEAVSDKKDSVLPQFRGLVDSFQPDSDRERWALFGVDLSLPAGLTVEKKVLQAGRTQLALVCKDARIEAQRWGFAEQLIAKHGFEPWARSMLEMPKSEATENETGLQFRQVGSALRAPVIAFARVQPERNQIASVKVTTRKEAWKPAWDWFV